jgi:acetolactate synthase I/III small subunit
VRIASMILRRRMHITKLDMITTQIEGVYRFTLGITETEEAVRKLMLQIDKQVEVFKTFYHTDPQILWQQHDIYISKTFGNLQSKSTADDLERSTVT